MQVKPLHQDAWRVDDDRGRSYSVWLHEGFSTWVIKSMGNGHYTASNSKRGVKIIAAVEAFRKQC